MRVGTSIGTHLHPADSLGACPGPVLAQADAAVCARQDSLTVGDAIGSGRLFAERAPDRPHPVRNQRPVGCMFLARCGV